MRQLEGHRPIYIFKDSGCNRGSMAPISSGRRQRLNFWIWLVVSSRSWMVASDNHILMA